VGHYLLDHPNPHGDHFYRTRRGGVLAIVVHVTAGLEDLDGGDDHSAEGTAAYAASTDREVSWHSGSDTDSVVELLPAAFTAFQCVGYNSRTYGHEISKSTPDWRTVPPAWIDRTLVRAAGYLAGKAHELGIPLRHASKAELDRAIAQNGAPVGFVAHADLDPTRRRDPGYIARPPAGDTFPWARFLSLMTAPPKESSLMEYVTTAVVPGHTGPWPNGRWTYIALRRDGRVEIINDVSALSGKSAWYHGDPVNTSRVNIGEAVGLELLVDQAGRMTGYVVLAADGGTFTYGSGVPLATVAGK
jgi:hypothetical protein